MAWLCSPLGGLFSAACWSRAVWFTHTMRSILRLSSFLDTISVFFVGLSLTFGFSSKFWGFWASLCCENAIGYKKIWNFYWNHLDFLKFISIIFAKIDLNVSMFVRGLAVLGVLSERRAQKLLKNYVLEAKNSTIQPRTGPYKSQNPKILSILRMVCVCLLRMYLEHVHPGDWKYFRSNHHSLSASSKYVLIRRPFVSLPDLFASAFS